MKPTVKLYYQQPDTMEAETEWLPLPDGQSIVLSVSPAYPEGGGQIGDSGGVEQNGIIIPFVDTQKHGIGRFIVRQDFPTISVEQQVRLCFDRPIPTEWNPDAPVIVRIDQARRQALSRSHTAAHLLWLALTSQFGNLYPVVRGCYIAETHGRFDLLIEKPSDDNLRSAEQFISVWVQGNHEIAMLSLPNEPECRIWQSEGRDIPCGGTHLNATGGVGPIVLRTKSKGKSGIRVIYELEPTS